MKTIKEEKKTNENNKREKEVSSKEKVSIMEEGLLKLYLVN